MKQPPKTEKLWTGQRVETEEPRAEIFTPQTGAKGRAAYEFGGLGGRTAGPLDPRTAPPPPPPPPPPPTPAVEQGQGPRKRRARKPVDPGSPASQSQALAEAVVGSLVDRLTAEAARKGGSLTIQDIQSLNHEFAKKAQSLQTVFEASFEEYVRARERASWEQARQYPFDRVIVKKFSHLFSEFEQAPARPGMVSRRILPGFFMALNMMLGPELIEGFQEQCRAIVDRIRAVHPEQFDWSLVYEDPEAKDIAIDALATMGLYFRDLAKRGEWLTTIINSHLPPPAEKAMGTPEGEWRLSPPSLKRLLAALFADLGDAIKDARTRARINRDHGPDAIATLMNVLERLGPR